MCHIYEYISKVQRELRGTAFSFIAESLLEGRISAGRSGFGGAGPTSRGLGLPTAPRHPSSVIAPALVPPNSSCPGARDSSISTCLTAWQDAKSAGEENMHVHTLRA